MRDELLHAVESVLFEPHKLDNVTLRPLEAQFAQMMQQTHAYGVNSGTAGLFLALKACEVGKGDEVITVGNSDISTTAAISHCGAMPVLCDVKESDYTIDPARVESLISERTAALLPVDLYGYPADVKSLRAIADEHDLRIIEDAALATGAWDYGQPVGAFADVAVFSFSASKPLGSAGNGGMVVTSQEDIAQRIQLLRSYGRSLTNPAGGADYMEHVVEGYNLPLDPLEAAVVSVKLPFLEEWTEERRRIAALYAQGLSDLGVGLPSFRSESQPTYYLYVVRVQNRDEVHKALRERGVETGLHYLPPIYQQPVYRNRYISTCTLPVTEKVAQELLCLPITPELLESEVHHVVEVLRELIGERSISQ